jgi:serine/threonine protein kinase
MTSKTHDLGKEAALMKALLSFPHPHVLPLLATEGTPQTSVAIVAPVALFGSMCDLVDHLDFESMTLSLADVSVATLQVAGAILHLAKLGIDHGDVCAKNVLVMHYDPEHATRMHVCLGDFGEACVLSNYATLHERLVLLVS